MLLRSSEWVVVVYFLYLFVAAVFSKVPSGRRVRVASVAFIVIVAVLGFSRADRSWFRQMRDWMPIVYLLARVSNARAACFSAERRHGMGAGCVRFALVGGTAIGVAERAPRWCLEVLELAYLLCYPLIPAGWICCESCRALGYKTSTGRL